MIFFRFDLLNILSILFVSRNFLKFIEYSLFLKMDDHRMHSSYMHCRMIHAPMCMEDLAHDHAQMYTVVHGLIHVLDDYLNIDLRTFPGMNSGFNAEPSVILQNFDQLHERLQWQKSRDFFIMLSIIVAAMSFLTYFLGVSLIISVLAGFLLCSDYINMGMLLILTYFVPFSLPYVIIAIVLMEAGLYYREKIKDDASKSLSAELRKSRSLLEEISRLNKTLEKQK